MMTSLFWGKDTIQPHSNYRRGEWLFAPNADTNKRMFNYKAKGQYNEFIF